MRLKSQIILPLDSVDESGNKVPAHPDIVILNNLVEGEIEKPEEQVAIEEFEKNIKKFQGYLVINENFETAYIPPYDDIASVIRHKFQGNEFVIVDLSKVEKTAFITANRINDNEENK